MKPKPPARNPYLSQNELKALGRLMGALRPAKLATIRNCEIFQAGAHRGETYTVADLNAMVRNFKLAQGVIDPPLITGHSEDQAFLQDSGLPAAGWLTRVYRRGAKLFGDFGGIPKSIARLVNGRAYRKVSVEVYDEPPEGAPPACKGKMLRRVALLGGDLPQIKTLADLPLAEYSERPPVCVPWRLVGSVESIRDGKAVRVTRFAEGADMAASEATAAMVSAIKAAMPDLPQEFLDSLDDSQLAMLLQGVSGGDTGGDAGGGDGGAPAAQAEWPEGVTRESAIADLVAAGEDAASLDAMSDDEVLALWQEKVGGGAAPMSEPSTTPAPAGAAAFAESVWRHLRPRIAGEVAGLKKDVARVRASERTRAASLKAESVDRFCEELRQAGYVTPAQIEKDRKTGKAVGVVRQMMELMSNVAKFGEKSDLERYVDSIKSFPPRHYGERVGDPATGQNGGALTPERRRELLSHTPLDKAILRDEAKRN